jgi:hypothetical protein
VMQEEPTAAAPRPSPTAPGQMPPRCSSRVIVWVLAVVGRELRLDRLVPGLGCSPAGAPRAQMS